MMRPRCTARYAVASLGSGGRLRLRLDRQGRPVASVPTPGEPDEEAALPELVSGGAAEPRLGAVFVQYAPPRVRL